MKRITHNVGITLIELIVVIILIAILSTFVVPRFVNLTGDAKINTDDKNAKILTTAARAIQAQTDSCPADMAALCANTNFAPDVCPPELNQDGVSWQIDVTTCTVTYS